MKREFQLRESDGWQSEGKWQNVRAGLVWECLPYRIVMRGEKERGEVWDLYWGRRKRPLGTWMILTEAMHAAYLDKVQRHERHVAGGKRSPGAGRPTRYRKDFDLHCEIHEAGWRTIQAVAKRLKASKADAVCGILDAVNPGLVLVPELKQGPG